jgi:coenzyme F420-reducing hydrogenase beta subunit
VDHLIDIVTSAAAEAQDTEGVEPIEPEAVEDRIVREKSEKSPFAATYYSRSLYEGQYVAQLRVYHRKRLRWETAQVIIRTAAELRQTLTNILYTGVSALFIAIDKAASYAERIATVAAVVQQTVDALGERFQAACEARITPVSSESLGFCRPDYFWQIDIPRESRARVVLMSEIVLYRNDKGEDLYASARSIEHNGKCSETRLTEKQLEILRERMERRPITERERARSMESQSFER